MLFLWILVTTLLGLAPGQTIYRSTRKDIKVLGDVQSYGLFEFDFDDKNLSYVSTPGFCPSWNGSCGVPSVGVTNPPNCPCDYTRPNSFCRDNTTYDPANDPCGCPILACNVSPALNYPVLHFGESITFKDTQLVVFVFFAYDPNCSSSIVLTMTSNNTYPPIPLVQLITPTGTQLSNEVLGSAIQNPNTWIICPEDPFWGRTVGVVNTPRGEGKGDITFTLELRPLPPPRPIAPTCSTPLDTTHTCFNPGQLDSFNGTAIPRRSLVRFIVPLTKSCGTLLWWSSASLVKLSFTDPWIWISNSSEGIQPRRARGQNEPALFGFCLQHPPVLGGTQHYIFGWVYASQSDTMYFDTEDQWTQLKSVVDIPPYKVPNELRAAATITCGDGGQIRSFTHWKEGDALSSIDDGFANVRFVWPQDDPHPFWPEPPSATSWQWSNGAVTDPTDPTPRPGRLALVLILNQRLRRVPSYYPIYLTHEFLNFSALPTCTITFNGLIFDSNGPIHTTFTKFLPHPNNQCDPSKYNELSAQQAEYLDVQESMEDSPDYITPALLGFKMDLIRASRPFYNCYDHLNTFIKTKIKNATSINTAICVADFSSSDFASDPCCIDPIGNRAYEIGCFRGQRDINYTSIELDTTLIDQEYPVYPQCAAQSMTLLNDFKNRQRDPTSSCSTTDKVSYDKQRSTAWYRCWYQYYGIDAIFSGLPCRHDDDCPDFHLCVADSLTCAVNQTRVALDFLDCVVGRMRMVDQFMVIRTCADLGVDCTNQTNSTSLELLSALNNLTLTCGSRPYWFAYNSTGQENPVAVNAGNFGCANTYCPAIRAKWSFSEDEVALAWDCQYPNSDTCDLVIQTTGIDTSCSITQCNYQTGFPNTTCGNITFCGICDDTYECRVLHAYPPVGGVCPVTQLCILPNTTVIPASVTQCQSYFGCTANATIPGTIVTEQTCSDYGFCSDATDVTYGIFSGDFGHYTGACNYLLDLVEPFDTARTLCSYPSRTSIFGCLNYNVTEDQCVTGQTFGFDPTLFKIQILGWLKKATTQEECMAYGRKCATQRGVRYPSSLVDIVVKPFNSTDSCFDPRPVYDWVPGRWTRGQPRTISSRPIIANTHPVLDPNRQPPFDARKLFSMFQEKSAIHFSFIVRAEAYCRVAEEKKILDDLFCQNGSACFPPVEGFTLSKLGVACSGDPNPIVAYPATITLGPDSQAPGICQIVRFSIQSLSLFEDNSVVGLATILLRLEEDTTWAVRNQNKAIIGKVLTNGIAVQFDNSMNDVTVCLLLPTVRLDYNESSKTYPRLDIAYGQIGDRSLIPLNKTVTFDGRFFCASGVDLRENFSYFMIQRFDSNDYLTMEQKTWDRSETIYISVVLALYCLGFLITLMGIIQRFGKETFIEVILIYFILEAFFACRIVLFSLALGNPNAIVEPAVGYVLIEFPLVLFFSFVTLFIITWSIVIRSTKLAMSGDMWIKLIRILAAIFITIVFGLFILLIILFQTIVVPPQFICHGTLLVYDSDRAFALTMSYRAIFSTFALILGVCLVIVGWLIIRMMMDPALEVPKITQLKVSLATIFGSFGLFAQAIYYLVITGLRSETQSLYLALSILLADETLPALFFVFCVVALPSPSKFIHSLTRSHTQSKSPEGQYPQSLKLKTSEPHSLSGGVAIGNSAEQAEPVNLSKVAGSS